MDVFVSSSYYVIKCSGRFLELFASDLELDLIVTVESSSLEVDMPNWQKVGHFHMSEKYRAVSDWSGSPVFFRQQRLQIHVPGCQFIFR